MCEGKHGLCVRCLLYSVDLRIGKQRVGVGDLMRYKKIGEIFGEVHLEHIYVLITWMHFRCWIGKENSDQIELDDDYQGVHADDK